MTALRCCSSASQGVVSICDRRLRLRIGYAFFARVAAHCARRRPVRGSLLGHTSDGRAPLEVSRSLQDVPIALDTRIFVLNTAQMITQSLSLLLRICTPPHLRQDYYITYAPVIQRTPEYRRRQGTNSSHCLYSRISDSLRHFSFISGVFSVLCNLTSTLCSHLSEVLFVQHLNFALSPCFFFHAMGVTQNVIHFC